MFVALWQIAAVAAAQIRPAGVVTILLFCPSVQGPAVCLSVACGYRAKTAKTFIKQRRMGS